MLPAVNPAAAWLWAIVSRVLTAVRIGVFENCNPASVFAQTSFRAMLALHQEAVAWDDRILIPYGEHLYVVQKPDGRRVVKCDCGHEFCEVERNWKLEALVHLRDTAESLRELYPAPMHCDPEWMNLREYLCPGCATLLEVEAVPPGYPVVFDFQPDIDGFYRDWLGEPLDPAPSG